MPLLFVLHLPSFLFTSHKFSSNFMTEMIILQYIQIICFISISYLSYRTSLPSLWFLAFLLCLILWISWSCVFLYSLVASWERTSTNSEISSWIQKLHVWMSSFTLTLEWWFHLDVGILDWKLVSISWRLPFVIPILFLHSERL